MVLAPRRIERVEEIRRQMEDLHLPSQSWTDLHSAGRSAGVVIVDTMGELAALYGIATVAFVGKSLFSPGGGHSLLEPVVQGVPVIHGPFVENSAGTADQLGRLGAARLVRGSEDVVNQVHRIFRAPEESRSAALEAKHWIETQRGASSTLAKLALEYLTQARPSP
jgi:3-deoxy-D-manno-octulosonic-acid transferase